MGDAAARSTGSRATPQRARPRSLLLAIAAFELGQQLRSHVFLVVVAISTALVAGASFLPQLRVAGIGVDGGVEAVVRLHLVWSLFFLFTAMAFTADAVLKDELTGFAPLIRSIDIKRRELVVGRFLGAFAAVALCYMSVPLGSVLAQVATGRPPAAGWPVFASAHLTAVAVFAMPNLFLSCAVFLGLATVARSMMAAHLGAVAVLILYGLGHAAGAGGGTAISAVAEPFGFAVAARGAADEVLLVNRLLWLAVGVVALGVACADFRPRRPLRPPAAIGVDRPPAPALARPPVAPRFTAATPWLQAGSRTRWEMGRVVRSPAFAVLLLMTAAGAGWALWSAPLLETSALVARLTESVRLTPTVVVLFYAGELTWSEREHRVEPLVASTPASSAVLLLPKVGALAAVLIALAVATAAAAVLVQVLRGATDQIRIDRLLLEYVLPRTYDWVLLACLALALQAASSGKLAGWGWMVLFLLASLALETARLNGDLYRYGGRLDRPEAAGLSLLHGALLRVYWGAAAALLLVGAYALWGRGLAPPLRSKLRAAAGRVRGPALVVAAAAAALFVTTGWWLATGR